MSSSKFKLLSPRGRLAALVLGLAGSLSSLAAVLAAFASASGELEPMLAKLRSEPAASAVAKAPAKRAGG